MGNFEDVPFEISSTTLHKLYKVALRQHFLGEAEGVIKEVKRDADNALAKIVQMRERMKEGVAGFQTSMTEMKNDIDKMKNSLKDITEKRNQIEELGDKMNMIDDERAQAERKMDAVETKMAEMRAEEELAEAEKALDSGKKVDLEERLVEAERRCAEA